LASADTSNAAVTAVGERRQATVLFADISGYTALCARSDAEQVQAMLTCFLAAMEQRVDSYGGTVIDRIGDAIMAVFGAPIAHGNDAERAVRCALDMHKTAATLHDCDGQPLRLHIGLASGEVVAARIGSGASSKYSVTGDTVNLAARLDALAADGETLISAPLHVVPEPARRGGAGGSSCRGAGAASGWTSGAGLRAAKSALLLTESGRIEEAEPALDAGLSLARTTGSRRFESLNLYCIAELRLQQGRRATRPGRDWTLPSPWRAKPAWGSLVRRCLDDAHGS